MGTTGIPAFDAYYDHGLTALLTGGAVVPAWSPDGSTLAYVDGPADERSGWRIDLGTGAVEPEAGQPARSAAAAFSGRALRAGPRGHAAGGSAG
jgi:hypothetical protein